MTWVAVAIGGSAVLGFLGSQGAASAQTNAANQANQTQMAQYNQSRQDQMPWMNRGNAAGNQLAYMMGLPGYRPTTSGSLGSTLQGGSTAPYGGNTLSSGMQGVGEIGGASHTQTMSDTGYMPDNSFPSGSLGSAMGGYGGDGSTSYGSDPNAQYNTGMGGYGSLSTPFSQTNWQQDPGYAFRLAEGQKALERSGAAKGMSLSGAQQKALMAYGQGMGSQEYGAAYNRYNNDQTNMYNRLAGIAGTGQQATQFTGSLGANTANQVSQNQLGAGNANAAAWTAGTGAISNGLNSWGNYNMWNSLNSGGGNTGMAYGSVGGTGGMGLSGPFGTDGAWASPYSGFGG